MSQVTTVQRAPVGARDERRDMIGRAIMVALVVSASWASIALGVDTSQAPSAYVERAAGTTGWARCAVVDPRANKVIEIKQGNGDTIIKVIGYVDAGDHIEYEHYVWRFARHLVTRLQGATLRERCVR